MIVFIVNWWIFLVSWILKPDSHVENSFVFVGRGKSGLRISEGRLVRYSFPIQGGRLNLHFAICRCVKLSTPALPALKQKPAICHMVTECQACHLFISTRNKVKWKCLRILRGEEKAHWFHTLLLYCLKREMMLGKWLSWFGYFYTVYGLLRSPSFIFTSR